MIHETDDGKRFCDCGDPHCRLNPERLGLTVEQALAVALFREKA